MAYTRITALWNGATGLPGYTRLKFAGELDSAAASAAAARMRTFFQALTSYLPTAVNITFAETAQIFETDQTLKGEIAYTLPTVVQGAGGTSYAGPSGMVVNWITGSFIGGRKVRGRTFLVPMSASIYGNDGSPTSGTVTAVTAAANALAAGSPAMVIAGSPSDGNFYQAGVSGGVAPKRTAVLRSRRD